MASGRRKPADHSRSLELAHVFARNHGLSHARLFLNIMGLTPGLTPHARLSRRGRMSNSSIAADVAARMHLDPERFQRALDLAGGWCDAGAVPSLGLLIGRADRMSPAILFGRQTAEADAPPIREDAIFLIASITKPIVAMGAMLLVERGQILLNDRVSDVIPDFAQSHKIAITIRHLLTHTSGLPDMLPNNRQLRAAHAPLSTFVEDTCAVQTAFPAGRGVQYQSMGFAVLGEIIGRVSGMPCAGVSAARVFRAVEHA